MEFNGKLPRILLLSSLTALLVACGGGGGSSSKSSAPTPNNPGGGGNNGGDGGSSASLVVDGVATKGVMKHARVTAFEVDDKGRQLRQVGESETDENGEYELSLEDNYEGGFLEIVVGVINGKTKMVCDASLCGSQARGSDIDLPSGFSLNALVKPQSSEKSVSASVTAWSSMAAKRAKVLAATSDLSAANQRATAEVSQTVGFDISKTRSRGLSQIASAVGAEAQYAIMNAAVAEIVFGGDSNASLADKLDAFTSALEDGVLGDSKDSFSVQDLSRKAEQVLNTTPNVDASAASAVRNQVVQLEAAGDEGFTPTYDDDLIVDDEASEADKIAAFQKFVSQTRSWIASIEALDSDELSAAIAVDADTISQLVDEDTQGQFQFLGELLSQVSDFLAANASDVQDLIRNGGNTAVDIQNTENTSVGTVTLSFANNNGLVIGMKGSLSGQANSTFLPFDLRLATSFPTERLILAEDGGKAGITLSQLLTSNSVVLTGAIGDGQGSASLTLNELSVAVGLSQVTSIDGDLEAAFRSASFMGDVVIQSQGARFAGTVDLNLVRLGDGHAWFDGLKSPPISLRSFKLSGEFNSADGSHNFSTAVSVDVRNAASFDTFSWLEYSGSYRDWDAVSLSPEDLGAHGSDWFTDAHFFNLDLTAYRSFAGIEGWLHGTGYYADNSPVLYYRDETTRRGQHFTTMETAASRLFPSEEIALVNTDLSEDSHRLSALIAAGEITSIQGAIGDYPHLSFTLEFPSEFFNDVMYVNSHDPVVDSWLTVDNDTGRATLQIIISDSEVISRVLAEFTGDLPQGSSISGLSLNSWGSSIQFERPATVDYYQQCLFAPEAELADLGRDSLLGWGYDLKSACAESTLNADHRSEALDEGQLANLNALALKQIAHRYGNDVELLSQIEFDYIYITSSTGGSAQMWTDFRLPEFKETAERFLDAAFTITSRIDIPELRSAQVTATVNRTSYRGGSVLANVSWNGGSYTIVISSDDISDTGTAKVRIYNAQGYELSMDVTLKDGDVENLTGSALINGEIIGSVELRDGAIPVIAYPDGKETVFETLY